MTQLAPVFEKTYRDYLEQVGRIDLKKRAPRLGIEVTGNGVARIPFFGTLYRVSAGGVADPSGKKPTHAVCVALCRYLLLCPDEAPRQTGWVTFKDFRDAAPYAGAFTRNTEEGIARHFSGRLNELETAADTLGGYPPAMELSHDLTRVFDALPKMPVLLAFNDADDMFPAQSTVLFEQRAEAYLDMECLAIVGWLLYERLRQADGATDELLP